MNTMKMGPRFLEHCFNYNLILMYEYVSFVLNLPFIHTCLNVNSTFFPPFVFSVNVATVQLC